MPNNFSSADARSLIQVHKNLLNGLERAAEFQISGKKALKIYADKLVTHQINQVLKSIPVEELGREKSGIRTKILREHGYKTVFDLNKAAASTLSKINGISEDGADLIKRSVQELVSKTKSEIKVRLSADDRYKEANELVLRIYQYRICTPYSKECKKILSQNRKWIEADLPALEPASNALKWLFTGKAKKAQAQESFQRLAQAITGSYGDVARNNLEHFEQYQSVGADEAWTDFLSNSIDYFTILEELSPGLLSSNATQFGLPEDLAKEIDQEPLYLDGLKCTLRRYQQWGVKYALHQKNALLGDEMGLGKTIQAIAAMVSLRNTGSKHFLVISPASVITNWCREIQKHSDLPVFKIHGDNKQDWLDHWKCSGGVAVTTYETTGFLLHDDLKISMLVVDEAHYIKNPDAKRTRNTRKLCDQAERLLFMTGTALENRVDEMIALMQILRPEVDVDVKNVAFLASAPQFREKVSPVYFRRKRDEVLAELPDLIENMEWCALGPEEEAVYKEAVLSDHFQNARRVSWSVDDLSLSSKARRLQEIVEDAAEDGRKIIVFSFFLNTISKVSALLGNRCVDPITGSVSPKRRQEIIDEFEKAPAGAVLPAQILAGGTGLNIQAASVVVICEPQLKPSIENQAISRAYRMGQARNVLVYRLLADETIDERITDLLNEKQIRFDAFADESVLGKESIQIDETGIKEIMEEEKQRILNT